MLARETKIHKLIQQRNFIEVQLGLLNKDGDPSYRYVGYLYPENREYFAKEGYVITTISTVEAFKITEGLPLNIFTPSDDIVLTTEELTTSERIATEIANISGDIDFILNQLFDEEDGFEELDIEADDVENE